MIENLTTDLKLIIDWMTKNGMRLNLDKTQLIVIGNAQNVTKIGKVEIIVDNITIKKTLKHSRASVSQSIQSLHGMSTLIKPPVVTILPQGQRIL